DHLTDALRGDLRCAAPLDRGLDVVDEPLHRVARQRLRPGLADRRRELAAVELLPRAVALQHLDPRGFGALACREPRVAAVARPPAPDGLSVLRLTRVDDAGVWLIADRAMHGPQDTGLGPLHLVAAATATLVRDLDVRPLTNAGGRCCRADARHRPARDAGRARAHRTRFRASEGRRHAFAKPAGEHAHAEPVAVPKRFRQHLSAAVTVRERIAVGYTIRRPDKNAVARRDRAARGRASS